MSCSVITLKLILAIVGLIDPLIFVNCEKVEGSIVRKHFSIAARCSISYIT